MTECLFAFQMTGPQERKAIRDWVADKDLDLDVVDALPKLGVGEAHIWSPQWLKVSKQIKISEKRTFNGSSTPEVGKAAKTRDLAPIDLDRIRGEMAETIERAKADDPKELRKQVAELKVQLAKASAVQPKAAPANTEAIAKRIQVVAEKAALRTKSAIASQAMAALKVTETAFRDVEAAREALQKLVADVAAAGSTVHDMPDHREREIVNGALDVSKRFTAGAASRSSVKASDATAETPSLSKAERALLAVLARFPAGRSRVQLSILSGYSIKSSSFANAIGALRSKGLAEGSDSIAITGQGKAAAAGIEPVPTDATTLRRLWMASLGKAERTMLEVLCHNHELSRAELSESAGYSMTSSSFTNAIGRLRSLELVSRGPGGLIELAEELR